MIALRGWMLSALVALAPWPAAAPAGPPRLSALQKFWISNVCGCTGDHRRHRVGRTTDASASRARSVHPIMRKLIKVPRRLVT